jgi:hypothetical protein
MGLHTEVQRWVDAVHAVDAQRALQSEGWPASMLLTVAQGGPHLEASEHDGNSFGALLNRAPRLMGAARGGQIRFRARLPSCSKH